MQKKSNTYFILIFFVHDKKTPAWTLGGPSNYAACHGSLCGRMPLLPNPSPRVRGSLR